MVIGVLLLLMMTIPGSIKGPLTISLPPEGPLLQLAWRTQGGMIVSMIIWATMYIFNRKTMSLIRDTAIPVLLDSALRAFFGFLWITALIIGCSLTITSHALVMNSSTGLYIIAVSIITKAEIDRFEYIGHGLFIFGVILMLLDPFAIKVGATDTWILGALIPLIGAGFGSILSFMNHKANSLHPIVTMTQFYFFSAIYQITFFPIFLRSDLFYTFDEKYGVFGWCSNFHNLLIVWCIVSPFTGVLEKISYLTVNSYFSLHTISIWVIFEPFIGQFWGIILKQDEIPGILTLIGLVIISLGFSIACYGEGLKHKEVLKVIKGNNMLSEDNIEDDSSLELKNMK